jgi:hypothetical protein
MFSNHFFKDKERELNTLEALQESLNYTDQNIENNILTIKNDLKTYFEKKTEGAIIRSKACWLREGERNSKLFFNLPDIPIEPGMMKEKGLLI